MLPETIDNIRMFVIVTKETIIPFYGKYHPAKDVLATAKNAY
jgi:hypothetical protein